MAVITVGDSATRDFIFRCIPNAALMSSEDTEFTTRKSTGQRNTNSTVHGSRSGGQVSLPLGQHYAGNGVPAQGERPASPDAPQSHNVQVTKGPKPGKTPAQIATENKIARHGEAERRHIAMQQAAAQKKAAAAAKKAARQKAAAQKKAAHAAKKSAKSKGSHKTHSQSASAQKRVPKGQTGGGRFAPGAARSGTAGSTGKTYAQLQADPQNRAMYSSLVGKGSAQQRQYLKGLNNTELQNLTGITYSSRTSNQSVVQARFAVAGELARRGLDRKAYGALG